MQPEPNAKQLIVERIKSTTNILVTVSRDPSVDELSAALGLTLMLNKLDKHATAVFSGAVPPAIEFLEPKKTFENSTDSLRDFIIALDKEKADRLRYKVEEDVVRIFITPYRTTITDKDLNFSQGDFNVELIIALGVEKREDIDTAVTAHGRILHDATVVTVNTKPEKSSVGSIDWSEPGASSLCEMLMSLSEALQSGLLDQQISTSLLTGIVSATDRFRNEHTSPKVMTMAAQLMAAGANQQLIATKLEESHELEVVKAEKTRDGSTNLKEGESEKVSKEETSDEEAAVLKPEPKKDGEMNIPHKKKEAKPVAEVQPEPEQEQEPDEEPVPEFQVQPEPEPEQEPQPEPEIESQPEPEPEPMPMPYPEPKVEEPVVQAKPVETPQETETELEAKLDAVIATPQVDIKKELAEVGEAVTEMPDSPISDQKGNWRERPMVAPAFGGTLNATVAHENEGSDDAGILSHGAAAPGLPPHFDQDSSSPEPVATPTEQDVLTEAIKSEPSSQLSYEPIPEPHETQMAVPAEQTMPTLSDLETQAQAVAPGNLDDARAAVDAALSSAPFNPAGQPLQSMGAQPLGGTIRPAEPTPFMQAGDPQAATPPALEPSLGADMAPVAPSAPALPPLPDFSTLPPLPDDQQPPHPAMTDPSLAQDPTITVPTDPAQFKIPGQP